MNDPVLTAMIVASFAAPLPTLAGSTAGGTWDCVAMDGAPIGTVILSDKTYAVVKLDGLVGSYGKLMQVGAAEYDLPHFVVIDGYLKDEVGAQGLALTGPRDNNHDLTGALFLAPFITGEAVPYCRRRVEPAA